MPDPIKPKKGRSRRAKKGWFVRRVKEGLRASRARRARRLR